jgi:hypothetical protein
MCGCAWERAQVPGTHDKVKRAHASGTAAALAAPVLQFCIMCLQYMYLQHKCDMCACAAYARPPVCSPAAAAAGQWTAGWSSGCACTTTTNSHAIPSNKHAAAGRMRSGLLSPTNTQRCLQLPAASNCKQLQREQVKTHDDDHPRPQPTPVPRAQGVGAGPLLRVFLGPASAPPPPPPALI